MAMALPGEGDMAREIGEDVDPDAIRLARETQRSANAARCLEALLGLRRRLASHGAYSPEAGAAGRRALANAALDLMAAADARLAEAEARRQMDAASNMTDRMAALVTLVHGVGGEAGERALARFEAAFGDNPLVMDKWFALQASIPGNATLERVTRLMTHPAFSSGNPNRVRALIGGFAASNPTGFNRPDGLGYLFVADRILELDRRNPQVAARLMTAFRSWRTLEPVRRAKARDAMESVARQRRLSRDLRDIVDRSLGG
jgi:aminopeptidase N